MTQIYAHRGSSGTHPENTLAAFREAIAAGADGIELDVHATFDRVPVVIHDRAVERTTNGTGNTDELSLAQLQTFDAGDGERVPTLAEVLELIGDRLHLDIEVKGHGIEAEVFRTLAGYPDLRWAISSFDWNTLRALRRLDAEAVLWPLAVEVTDELFTTAAELASPAVSLFAAAYAADTASALRAAGLEVVVWTVNDEDEARRVRDLRAFALCTDFPRRIAAALRGS
jgi:glycerophosphoryl diester phosphodiesterase